ncbi:MAG: hypothetical protein Q4B70_11400 [Lachnospiraceae bacterium]|nr:hypothetical protein [Lachnospiraceae bacterium]
MKLRKNLKHSRYFALVWVVLLLMIIHLAVCAEETSGEAETSNYNINIEVSHAKIKLSGTSKGQKQELTIENSRVCSFDLETGLKIEITPETGYYIEKAEDGKHSIENMANSINWEIESLSEKNDHIQVVTKKIESILEMTKKQTELRYGNEYGLDELFSIAEKVPVEALDIRYTFSMAKKAQVDGKVEIIDEGRKLSVPEYTLEDTVDLLVIGERKGEKIFESGTFQFTVSGNGILKGEDYELGDGYGQRIDGVYYVRNLDKLFLNAKNYTDFRLLQENGTPLREWMSISKNQTLDKMVGEGIIYLQMKKEEGEKIVSERVGFVYDQTPPEIKVNIIGTAVEGEKINDENIVWYQSADLEAVIKEEGAGIQEVSYYIDDNTKKKPVSFEDGKYKLACTEEGYHIYTIFVVDKAGNESQLEKEINCDTTPPVISDIQYYNEKGKTSGTKKTEEEIWYNGNSLKLVFQVSEQKENTKVSGIKEVKYRLEEGKESVIQKNENGSYEIFCEEGIHTYTISAVDFVGNEKKYQQIVCYDNTSPSDEVYVKYISDLKEKESEENITLFQRLKEKAEKFFSKERLIIQVFVRDNQTPSYVEGSGIKTIDANLSGLPQSEGGWERLEDSAIVNTEEKTRYTVFQKKILLSENNIDYLKTKLVLNRITDYAGNECREVKPDLLGEDNTILYMDGTSPKLSVNLTKGKAEEMAGILFDNVIYYKNDYVPVFFMKEDFFFDDKGEENGVTQYNVNLIDENEMEESSFLSGKWNTDVQGSVYTYQKV